jgi:hypothetical protein
LNADAWNGETDDDQKVRALIDATREINLLSYRGYASTDTQALTWPRAYAEIPAEDATVADTYYLTTEIPQRIKDAVCELALQFLIAGTTDLASLPDTQGVIEKTIGPITTRWADPYTRPVDLKRFPRVWNFVKPLLITQGNSVPLVRG